ncbi:MAG TPA: metal ABC transporter substrate-binding protein [Smithella sp.]|nr:metal ABC transporter substrate-binding protein [Smithella sp.]
MPRKFILVLMFVLSFLPVSCRQKPEPVNPSKLSVVASIFPLYDFARQVGGDKIEVTLLVPPGTDLHHYELKPADIVKVGQCDIFLFTNFEMENWAYKIIGTASKKSSMLAVETGSGAFLLPLSDSEHDQEAQAAGFDPHIWLDADNAKKMVDNIVAAFIQKDSRNSDYYLKNASDYKMKISALDEQYRKELSACKKRTLLHAGHWAFAYLAKRYNLRYIAAYNILAESEPAPQTVLFLVDQIKSEGVRYLYYEDMINPRLAQMISRETGAGLLKLSNGHDVSAENIRKGETFISLMEKNLENLKKGLECP